MSKAFLRKTDSKVSVKLYGTSLNETISFADLVATGRDQLISGGTPKANVIAMWWTGAAGVTITIKRNNVEIVTLLTDASNSFDFEDTHFVDTINNDYPIVVTSDGLCQVYMQIRKIAGYETFIETAAYGSYDDETKVGARTGSPV